MTWWLPLAFIPLWGLVVYMVNRAEKRRIDEVVEMIRERSFMMAVASARWLSELDADRRALLSSAGPGRVRLLERPIDNLGMHGAIEIWQVDGERVRLISRFTCNLLSLRDHQVIGAALAESGARFVVLGHEDQIVVCPDAP